VLNPIANFFQAYFAHPWVLLFLLLLPVLALLKGRQGQPAAFVYSSLKLVGGFSSPTRARAGQILATFRWLTLATLIIALAQPRLSQSETKITASGVDIVVAIDLSGSMESEDFEMRGERVNRINMAKAVLKKFIEKRPSDRIGLVAFSGKAYIACPLTLDHDFLEQNIDRLQLHMIEDGTAIGSGLTAGLNRLSELKSKSKIVILMTDGQNNAGKIQPLTAAEAAQGLGVKVYTIGIGTRGQAPMPVNFFGQKRYQMVPVDIDEDTLTKIADKTGGKYYRADNAERFQQIYAEIDKLEKTEAEVKKFTHFRERFQIILALGVALLMAELVLANTALRRLP
jgi:Ca-activated chloride channel family protein